MPPASAFDTLDARHATTREEAAMLFASGEIKEAGDLLIKELSASGREAPRPIWYMLLAVYQAQDDRASFEKLAGFFAQRFETSPPAWRPVVTTRRPKLGRNVLILEGLPSQVSPEKWRDFLASAREAGFCRLDISRLRLPETAETFATEAQPLLDLMGRLTRSRVKLLLMGDGALREQLQAQVDHGVWGNPALKAAWLLLLTLLQWRGEADPYDRLAMAFMDHFDVSPPGYETEAVLAQDGLDREGEEQAAVLDEAAMAHVCERLASSYRSQGQVVWDLANVSRITYPAAVSLATFLARVGFQAKRMMVEHASELLVALFDSTGVSPQVTYLQRAR
jgi:ABC-type transporter Mla MlaB component